MQTIELAVAAEEIGIDGAFVRVHHFARQLASPFPLLAAIGARTSRIEIGTAVIDMRYENPLYMAEEAAAADLISDGRLQLGISRGSPEPALRGSESFGYVPGEGQTDADLARAKHEALSRGDRRRRGRARRYRRDDGLACDARDPAAVARARPSGSGGAPALGQTAPWAAEQGMNLMSSTLLVEDTGRAVRRAAGRADRALPRSLGAGRLGARAADLGQPQRHPDHQRHRPHVLRRARASGDGPTRSATSRGRSPASARATSASPT